MSSFILCRFSIFRPFLGFFPKNQPNQIFPEKSGSVTVDPLWSPNFIKKQAETHWTTVKKEQINKQKKNKIKKLKKLKIKKLNKNKNKNLK